MSAPRLWGFDDEQDDALAWRFRQLPWEGLADLVGVSSRTLYRHLLPRGWKRDAGGRLVAAPCRDCGRAVEPERLGASRRCERCRFGERDARVLNEMQKRGLAA